MEKPIALFSHLGLSPRGKEPWEHAVDPTPQSTHPGKGPVNLCGQLGLVRRQFWGQVPGAWSREAAGVLGGHCPHPRGLASLEEWHMGPSKAHGPGIQGLRMAFIFLH